MSTMVGEPEQGSPDRTAGWVFPMSEAVVTTRLGLLAASSVFGATAFVVLGALAAVIAVTDPGTLQIGAPFVLLAFAALFLLSWRLEPVSVRGATLFLVVVVGLMTGLAVVSAQSGSVEDAGTSGFALSMAKVSIVLLTASLDRWSLGVAGAVAGYLLGELPVLVTAALTGFDYHFDGPPFAVMVGVALMYALFPLARSRGRRESHLLDAAARRSRAQRSRELESQDVVAQLHDTLLSDLVLIALRPPGALSPEERRRLEVSLASGAMLTVLREETPHGLRARIESIAEASGLRLVVVGELDELEALGASARAAMVAALEQCVINVARHAQTDSVRIRVESEPNRVTTTVSDEGIGFDDAAVPADRFGISASVRGRIRRHGGRVHLDTAVGRGTRVVIELPRGGEG